MNDLLANYRNQFQDWYDGLQFSSIHKRTFAVIAVLVLSVSGVVVAKGHAVPVALPVTEPIILVARSLVVDVAGGVKKPGVYSLPANSRVTDAIAAAGGIRKGTDTSDVNLARMVRDGEQIYVQPAVSVSTFSTSRQNTRAPGRVGLTNINRATVNELESLPGIGPVIALKIFTYRNVNGPYSSIEDLLKVSGIGSAKLAALKSKVRV